MPENVEVKIETPPDPKIETQTNNDAVAAAGVVVAAAQGAAALAEVEAAKTNERAATEIAATKGDVEWLKEKVNQHGQQLETIHKGTETTNTLLKEMSDQMKAARQSEPQSIQQPQSVEPEPEPENENEEGPPEQKIKLKRRRLI